MCESDLNWHLQSTAIDLIQKKIRKIAEKEGLSQGDDAAYAQITRDICSIDETEQKDRQLMEIYTPDYPLKNINELELELELELEFEFELELGKFTFNSNYLTNNSELIFPKLNKGNSNDLLSIVNNSVSLKIAALKKLELEKSTPSNSDHYSQSLPKDLTIATHQLQTDINTSISINHQKSAEGLDWSTCSSYYDVRNYFFYNCFYYCY